MMTFPPPLCIKVMWKNKGVSWELLKQCLSERAQRWTQEKLAFFHNLFNRNINNVRFISENKKWSTSLETESSEISCPPLLVIGSLKCLGVFFHLLSVHNVSTFQWQLNVALTALLPNPPLGEFATVHYHYHVRRSTSLLMFNVHFFLSSYVAYYRNNR